MDLDSGAGLLHRLTSYTPSRAWDEPVDDPRVRHDLVPNDPATRPPQLKAYPAGLDVVPLPRDLPTPAVDAVDVLAGVAAGSSRPLDLARLGRVLFLGAGVVRTVEHAGRTMLFRAAGSAGARFPLEVYVSARGVEGLPDGVHWYDPARHALVRVGLVAGGAATTLVVTGVPWRTGWRYAERGWRHLYWDAGTVLAQLEAAAASDGLAPRVRSLFPDGVVRRLVGADGVHEYPLVLLTFGDGEPAVTPSAEAVAGDLPQVELPLCTQAQRAGEREVLGAAWPVGGVVPVPVPEPLSRPSSSGVSSSGVSSSGVSSGTLDEVVLRRGSQRLMDPSRTLPRSHLEWSTAVAMHGIDVPHAVAVHGVDDVAQGVHSWPLLDVPMVAGDVRDRFYELSLRQRLASEAAYVVVSYAEGSALDDRTYRDAQLAAGVVEGRLHLAAYALGAGASGMTFYDSLLPDVVGLPDDAVGLLLTCVGVPEYASKPGGRPGEPVQVRMVTPRLGDL